MRGTYGGMLNTWIQRVCWSRCECGVPSVSERWKKRMSQRQRRLQSKAKTNYKHTLALWWISLRSVKWKSSLWFVLASPEVVTRFLFFFFCTFLIFTRNSNFSAVLTTKTESYSKLCKLNSRPHKHQAARSSDTIIIVKWQMTSLSMSMVTRTATRPAAKQCASRVSRRARQRIRRKWKWE